MKKKIIITSVLVVFMLVAISFGTATNTQTTKPNEKKLSPLFDIRTRQATTGYAKEITENIKTRFINRIFFSPSQLMGNSEGISIRYYLNDKGTASVDYECTNICTWGLVCGLTLAEGRSCNLVFCTAYNCPTTTTHPCN